MAFSARLGIKPTATPGRIKLGTVDTLTNPTTIVVPSTQYFTGILGLSRSLESRIVLARAFMRLVASPAQTASVSFRGNLTLSLANRFLFTSAITILTQARRLILKVVQRTTTQLDTLPATIDVGRVELYPLGVDFTQYVASVDTVSTPSVVLSLKTTGTVIDNSTWLIGNSMSINGNIVQVPMNTSILRFGQTYILALTVKLNTNKTLTSTTTIDVVA